MNKPMKNEPLFSAETLAEIEMSEIFGGCDANANTCLCAAGSASRNI